MRNAVRQRTMIPEDTRRDIPAIPTEKIAGWLAFFLCSGVSASQFCRAKTTAVLEEGQLSRENGMAGIQGDKVRTSQSSCDSTEISDWPQCDGVAVRMNAYLFLVNILMDCGQLELGEVTSDERAGLTAAIGRVVAMVPASVGQGQSDYAPAHPDKIGTNTLDMSLSDSFLVGSM